MKIRYYILSILLFSYLSGLTQTKGFIGKKNEISFDVFALAYNKFIGVNYKRSLGTNTSINLSYSVFNKQGDLGDSYKWGLIPQKSKVKYGTYESKGINWSIAFLYSNPNTGMNMPIGYYAGWGFDYLSTTLKINKSSLGTNNSGISLSDSSDYLHKEYRLYYVVGKDTYLTNNFVLDLYITPGIELGTMKNKNEEQELYLGEGGTSIVYPRRGQLMLNNTFNAYYFSFFVFFQAKIGYLF